MEYTGTGVVIVRFQTPALHTGHKHLLEWVFARHETLCVVLASKLAVATEKDPLSFQTRKDMVLESYPKAKVIEIFDCPSDKIWSKRIDQAISQVCGLDATLYGSRDSFIPYYHGTYKTVNVDPVESLSGTELRSTCPTHNSIDYRMGVIHAVNERMPIVYPTVDCVPYKKENGMYYILLGHKESDEEKYRFIGGFTDKNDSSFEKAAIRELAEETGGNLKHKKTEYIMSCAVDDFRYKNTKDGVITTFFCFEYENGTAVATDDIDEVKWFPLNKLQENIVSFHKPLAENLITFLNAKQSFCTKLINFFKIFFNIKN